MELKAGNIVKAFHPQTMGVIHDGLITIVQPKRVRVEFRMSIGTQKRFWIPTDHVTEVIGHSRSYKR